MAFASTRSPSDEKEPTVCYQELFRHPSMTAIRARRRYSPEQLAGRTRKDHEWSENLKLLPISFKSAIDLQASFSTLPEDIARDRDLVTLQGATTSAVLCERTMLGPGLNPFA